MRSAAADIAETARLDFERGALARLRKLGVRLRLYVLLDGCAVIGAVLLAAILLSLSLDSTLRLGWEMRLVLTAAIVVATAWLVGKWVLRPLAVRVRDVDLAILVERRHPQLASCLISACEFASAAGKRDRPTQHDAMVNAVIRQADRAAATLRFADALNHHRAGRQAATLAAVTLVMLGLVWIEPAVMGLWFERNVLLREVDWPLRHHLTVEGLIDGRLVVPRGEDITVSAAVDLGFEVPRQVYVQYRGASGARGRQQMPEISGQPVRFTHTFERLSETLECRIIGGDAETAPFTVEVIDRPAISGLRIGIAPPAYTHLDPYELRPGQTVAEALPGSEIRLHIDTSRPIVTAKLVRESAGRQESLANAVPVTDQRFTAADRPTASAAYFFELIDEQGLSSIGLRSAPMRIAVRLIADQPPAVRMRIHGAGDMITPQAVLPIETEFTDAYGLASAAILFTTPKSQDKPLTEPLQGFEPRARIFNRSVDWSVSEHELAQGDRLTLWAQAADFDDVSGPNVGKSPPAAFRIVSREELLTELNRRQQEYRQDFERYLRRQEELYSSLLSLSRPRGSKSPSSPGGTGSLPARALADKPPVPPEASKPIEIGSQEDRRQRPQQFRQLARQQRDQAAQLNAVAQRFDQVLSELRVNRLATPDVENRLADGVVEPIRRLGRDQIPPAAGLLDELSERENAAQLQQAGSAQLAIRNEMNAILSRMLEWERFQEAVILLRDVLHMQQSVGKETELQIEKDILGTEPASGPSK